MTAAHGSRRRRWPRPLVRAFFERFNRASTGCRTGYGRADARLVPRWASMLVSMPA